MKAPRIIAAVALLISSAAGSDAHAEGDVSRVEADEPRLGGRDTRGYRAPDEAPSPDPDPPQQPGVPVPDGKPTLGTEVDEAARIKTLFLGGVGLLALPVADVCPFEQTNCEPGETGLAFSLKALGEVYDFAFGAGITFAFGLRGSEAVDPDGSLGREHSRSYFMIEGLFRYFLPSVGDWHWWVGAGLGLAIVNDSWSTTEDRDPYDDTAFVGPRASTLSSEGLTVGGGVGGHWLFTEHWLFGTQLRYSNWILPSRAETPFGDSASLAGRIDVIEAGLTIGFRIPL